MKLALVSDQHITRASRWEEGLRILDWIADTLAERKPDVIALGGDLFDGRPTSEEWVVAARWLMRLADVAPVVGVYGNHDVQASLDVFPSLRARHPIAIYSAPAVHHVAGAAIACLPWPRKGDLLAALGQPVSHEQAGQVATEALRAILLGMGAQLEAHPGPRVFLGHCMVRGSRLSTGQPIMPGTDFEVGLEDVALAKAQAYLLGHVHCPNRFDVLGAPGVMPGSPRRTSFGEVEQKTIALVTIEGDRVDVEDVVTPCTPMLLLETQWAPAHVGLPGDVVVPAGFTDFAYAPVSGAEVRFRYHVEAEHRDAARAAAADVRALLTGAGAVVVKLEEVVEASVRARAPEVAAARTVADKLRAYWRAKDDEPSPTRAARLVSRLGELEGA